MPISDYALCVGINRYPGLTPLAGAEADAQAFYDWVISRGGVAIPNAKLILSSQYPTPAQTSKAQPASQEIWDFFEELRNIANHNNANNLGFVVGRRLYLFFSGHGFSPTLDTSGVLMANAEWDTPHNLSAKAWADRLYENGWFEEVLLFQDACREQVNDAELTPPYVKKSVMRGIGSRKRFYAFSAKSPLLALEKPVAGVVRGIFSSTLMAALEGGACNPQTGEINAWQLKSYLLSNMAARLEPAELTNEDISKWPEVFDLDPFIILPAPASAAESAMFPVRGHMDGGADAGRAAAPGPGMFPVRITLMAPGSGTQILDSGRNVVATVPAGVVVWDTQLPLGLFELVTHGKSGVVFKVSGALGPTGQAEVVNVL